ncbi:MAG TPA: YwqG family protein [Ktedonobacteraceae bacterium]
MDKAEIQEALIKAGLSYLVPHIDALVRNSIRIFTKPVDERCVPVGTSKLGGMPDLLPRSRWPSWHGVPQSFIGQIRLEELQPYDTQKLLPAEGMFWFFYAAQQDAYGDDPADRGAWLVLFETSSLDKLRRRSAPSRLPRPARFNPCSLSYASELTMAVQPELEIPGLQWDNNEQRKYDDVFAVFHATDELSVPHHRMLGFADVLQDDMREQCQLYSNGITDWESPEAETLAKDAHNWQLLLQVDTDEAMGTRWASTGRLYYWLKNLRLNVGPLTDTWLVLQSE